ncbi:TIGR04255 family protein [Terrabacter sp. NPDC080008]|uniref:TIGR04255 family protein n=1 Tax=Terrabacter sp. NPDC080008 TaxID=3155176 RepID=UPI00344CCDE1
MTDYDTSHDGPIGGLPPADPVLLRNPQIEAALVEIRFSGVEHEVASKVAFRVRDAAERSGFEFPQMRATQSQEITVRIEDGKALPDLQERASGWQMATEDGHLAVTLLPGVFAVQATKYERWRTTLEPVLAQVAEAVEATMSPAMLNRVGVRFINRLTRADAESPLAWKDAINPTFLGSLLDPNIGPKVVGTQQQAEVRLGPAKGALIRHGLFSDTARLGAYSYLVDLDVFDQAASPFEADRIVTTARTLDRTALSLFQQIVLPSYRATMNPYARVDATGTVIATVDRKQSDVEGGER